MTNTFTINREQQSQLHNARVYFNLFKDKYSEIFGKEVMRDFNQAFNYFIQAHNPIRELEDKRSEERFDHYHSIQQLYKLSAVWSMTEYDRLDEPVDRDIKTIKYYDIVVPVVQRYPEREKTWIDVYEACDVAIKESGDEHHIFIEYLHREETDPEGQYTLSTGS